MQALFVHGMGRSPLSGWPMLWRLKRAGLAVASFGYNVSRESFDQIAARLASRIDAMAALDRYVLIGHSLGGVLLRSALNSKGRDSRQPDRVFLLGSPIKSSRLAEQLGENLIFRTLTRDCGALLGSNERMSGVGGLSVPTTSIAGVRGLPWKQSVFRGELNDGVVALSEVTDDWITDQVQVPVIHTLLPSSQHVSQVLLDRLR